jgi:toxin ParE1/3/4
VAKLIWTEAALRDLEDIADYISLVNLPAAKRLVVKVRERIRLLESWPESGRIPHETDSQIYRELVINPVRLFYRHTEGRVYILHIMRAERELRKYLLQSGDSLS